jgi:hypothetical protein
MTMKKIIYLALIMLFVIILGACAKAIPQSANDMIKPGEKIGDFLITAGKEGDVTYTWDLDCVKQGEGENYVCNATVGTKVNISVGIYDDTYSGKLDDVWSGHTYKLFIENRPVNLKAFGFIDVNQPQVGKMRHWNVVVFTDKPSEITLQDSGVVHGDPFESTMTYTFSAP